MPPGPNLGSAVMTTTSAWRRLVAGLLLLASTWAQAGVDWRTHRDPAGFSIQVPLGWQVQSDRLTDIAAGDAQGRAVALVRARPARGDLGRWLTQDYPRSEPGMAGYQVDGVQASGADVAQAWVRYTNPQGLAKRARVVVVRRGEMATVFVASAPAELLAQQLPVLARVLDSVRFEAPRGGAPGASLPPLSYARWVDPREGAFAVELPAGWHTQGGLQRTTWNRRVVYQATSPDGAAMLFAGDATMPRIFILPNEITARYGQGSNSSWGPDAMFVAPFHSAGQLGALLVKQRFGGQVTATRPRADLVQIAQRNPLLPPGTSAATAADVEFRLSDGRIGVLTLSTFGNTTAGVGGNWWADGVHGFIAPPERAAQTGLALAHLVASTQVNPAWAQGERQHELRLGQQYTAYLQHAQALQQQTIAQRWASQDAIARGRRDGLGGTVRLQDPQTGEIFETTASDRYYFRVTAADRPTVLGSDVDARPLPQVDLRRLLQVGVDVPDR